MAGLAASDQATGLVLARQKLLEQNSLRRNGLGVVAGQQRRDLVAERQQATRLETDDRHAATGIGQQRCERAPRFARGCFDMPDDRNVRPQQSGRVLPSTGVATCTG